MLPICVNTNETFDSSYSSSSSFSPYSSFNGDDDFSQRMQQQFINDNTNIENSGNVEDIINNNTIITGGNVSGIEVGKISGNDDNGEIEGNSSNSCSNYRRAKRSPNPASRIGVTNFVNVIRS